MQDIQATVDQMTECFQLLQAQPDKGGAEPPAASEDAAGDEDWEDVRTAAEGASALAVVLFHKIRSLSMGRKPLCRMSS